jgi:hypothetical protein
MLRFEARLGEGETMSVGCHHTQLASFDREQQPVQVVANVLLRHRVLHEHEQRSQCSLRHRHFADVIAAGRKARKVVRRQGLQRETAAPGLQLQPVRRALERYFRFRGQGTQDVLQLARRSRNRGGSCLRTERSLAADLNLQVSGQQRHAVLAPVEQNVRQDRQRVSTLNDPAHRLQRRQQFVT